MLGSLADLEYAATPIIAARRWEVSEFVRGVDYYELLGVDRHASAAEIKSAYRALARNLHPDMGGTPGTFRLLREAYETLNDPVRRADYDHTQAAEPVTSDEPTTDRRRSPAKRREFGDDPDYEPALPRMAPDGIPWWDTVDPGEPIRFLPIIGPERTPSLALASGWGLLLVAGLSAGLTSMLLAVWLTITVSMGAVVLVVIRRYLDARRVDRLFVSEFGQQAVFGRPEPEQPQLLTAELLMKYLTRLPGVRIFHGVAWPDSVFADIDHVVLCGRRLVLIESKRWLPGHYSMDADGELWRNGHRFRGGTTRLPDSVAEFEELLPDVEVRGALLVYPSRAGAVTTEESDEGMPLTPEQFVRDVGQWLAQDPAAVDRDVFRLILRHVVSES